MLNNKQKPKVAIIGFGRFGKLMAEILIPFVDVFVISRHKIKDKKYKQIEYSDLKNIDWIILTVPISIIAEILNKIKPFVKKGTIIMDTASVKTFPCQWMEDAFKGEEVELLGSHPMFGPDSAKRGLKGLQIVFCPLNIKKKNLEIIKNIFLKLKLEILITSPREHDEESAISLALVHFIGRGLERARIKDLKISTLGFKRLLQLKENVTNDSEKLFRDMHIFNPYAEKYREIFLNSLQEINLKLKNKIY